MGREFKTLQEVSLFLESDWFGNLFSEYFIKHGHVYQQFLNKKRYRLSEDEKISSRVLNHWIKEGLFYDYRSEGRGWRKFSISELIQIRIIKKLRSFGMELSKIKNVRQYIDSYNKEDSLACFLLDFYISYGQISQEPIQLVVSDTGDAILVRQKMLDQILKMGMLLNYIVIDINSLFLKGKRAFPKMTKNVPSELEKEINNYIDKKEIKSIEIKIKEEEYIITNEILLKDRESASGIINLCICSKKKKRLL